MKEREISRHPSYHNRFRSSLDSVGTSPTSDRPQNLSVSGLTPDKETTLVWPGSAKRHQRTRTSVSSTVRSISFESNPDDVFVDVEHQDDTNVNGKIFIRATQSTASTTSMLPNPYNKFNHIMHSVVWCACCLYFVLICCMPAVHYMEKSDTAFRSGNDMKAKRTARMSTLMFVAGTIIAVAVYAAILFLVIFFTAYNT